MFSYRFVEVRQKTEKVNVNKILLCKVEYLRNGEPSSFEDCSFSTKREYRDAFNEALSFPVEKYFSDNGTFMLSKNNGTWVWQREISEEELYSVYGGE